MKMLCQKSKTIELGSITVIAAILLTALIAFAALAVDLTTRAAVSEQSQQHAQLAALSALEEYFDSEGNNEEKLANALDRAQELTGDNLTLKMPTSSSESNSRLGLAGADSAAAVLEPGRYFFELPRDGTNPCLENLSPPCFVPVTETNTANAFRIRGSIYPETRFSFAQAAGMGDRFSAEVHAVATVVPRRGVFLVDISNSMTRETHQSPQAGRDGYQYAYKLCAENPGDICSATDRVNHDDSWNWLQTLTERPESEIENAIPTLHYKNDYEEVHVLSDADFNASPSYAEHHPNPNSVNPNEPMSGSLYTSEPGLYHVDTFREGGYDGPDPLTTALRGLNKAVRLFQERKVAGDKMAIMFYDHNLRWPRIVKLTDDFDYIEKLTDVETLDDPDRGLRLMLRHGIFPDRGGFTSTVSAILQAINHLEASANPETPSADFIAHIGDGMTNCSPCGEYNPSEFNPMMDLTGDGVVNSADRNRANLCLTALTLADPLCTNADLDGDGLLTQNDYNLVSSAVEASWGASNCNTQACNDSYTYNSTAMRTLNNIAQTVLAPATIPFHAIVVGANVGPHTLDIQDPNQPGRCLSDREARSAGLPYAMGGGQYGQWLSSSQLSTAWDNASATNPFFRSTYNMYLLAEATGGIFGPLRPTLDGCDPELTPTCNNTNPIRRMTDPLCRSQTAQVESYMEEILKTNPYTIVYDPDRAPYQPN